eukprot:1422631-Pyramimonas_sp.AAC.1
MLRGRTQGPVRAKMGVGRTKGNGGSRQRQGLHVRHVGVDATRPKPFRASIVATFFRAWML